MSKRNRRKPQNKYIQGGGVGGTHKESDNLTKQAEGRLWQPYQPSVRYSLNILEF